MRIDRDGLIEIGTAIDSPRHEEDAPILVEAKRLRKNVGSEREDACLPWKDASPAAGRERAELVASPKHEPTTRGRPERRGSPEGAKSSLLVASRARHGGELKKSGQRFDGTREPRKGAEGARRPPDAEEREAARRGRCGGRPPRCDGRDTGAVTAAWSVSAPTTRAPPSARPGARPKSASAGRPFSRPERARDRRAARALNPHRPTGSLSLTTARAATSGSTSISTPFHPLFSEMIACSMPF